MGEQEIYLDNHATTPCDPAVIDSMLPALREDVGNAASRQHSFGRRAASRVEAARRAIGSLLRPSVDPTNSAREIVFTSGATESNNLAIKGACEYVWSTRSAETLRDESPKGHVVTTRIEHKAVLDTCQRLESLGLSVTYLPVDGDGRVRPDDLRAALRDDTILASVMYANNETGTVQPIAELAAICKECSVLFHSDAAQALAWLPCDVDELGIDLLSISAHKVYGPQGVGALYVRRRPRARLLGQIDGGGHERGHRSGTLNVPGIVGFGRACELLGEQRARDTQRVAELRDDLLARLRAGLPGIILNGSAEHRLAGNLNVTFPGVDVRAILEELDGVAVSSGAACSSANWDASYVLRSLGNETSIEFGGVRFGLGRFTTPADVEGAAERVLAAVERARIRPATSLDACEVSCDAPASAEPTGDVPPERSHKGP
ncbi:MAG: cysteine desulfurase family protein [Planctomycetota bacterium]